MSTLTDYLTSIANAIRSVKRTSANINAANFSSQILTLNDTTDADATASDILTPKTAYVNGVKIIGTGTGGGGGESKVLKDINFYDYDGKLLQSYYTSDLPLTALPDGPEHSNNEVPLTFQQWTHTLAQVNACTDKLDVEATFIPTDGKTHLIINIAAEGRMTMPLYISQTVANGVSIDWGDGSSTQTLAGTGNVNTTHTYTTVGRYDITLTAAIGCTLGLGAGSNGYCVMGSTNNAGRVYCNMLQESYIGSGVTTIGNYAFQYCYSLTSIIIPNSVTSIGSNTFSNCSSLASVTIPNSVRSINSYAFQYCYSLTSIIIPASVTSISSYMFSNCYSLTSIIIPNSVTSIGSNTFGYCYSLTSIIIPASVTSISNYAFQYCYSLASVTIPNSVRSISTSTFQYCYSLASIALSNIVTSIGSYMFSNCYSLASVTIPASVTSISSYAFQYCYGMAIYDFSDCTSIPTLAATNAFNNIPSDCIIKIPSALFATWSTATNWSTYASNMVAV